MKALWIDAGNGAAGDMLLAALLDAGADLAAVEAGLAALPVEAVSLELTQVRRHGLRAVHASVHAPESTVRRTLPDVTALIEAADLPTAVSTFATTTFTKLAAAEARVHGTALTEVHFHEVGALDAIVDVVGCALALHQLGLLDDAERIVSPVAVGSGVVHAAHGPLPVPAPAVVELLTAAAAPVADHPARRELCTPTGAALLSTLATGWGPPPAATLRSVGVGAGSADPPGHPNVLRVLVGERQPGGAAGRSQGLPRDGQVAGGGWHETSLWQLETTIDDLDPRVWPDLLEQLRAAGVADAWCTPVLMRKGRPGQVLTVLVDDDRLDTACRMVFTQTPTLGVRLAPVRRLALARDQRDVTVAGGTVRVKRGLLDGRVVTVQPEYDDARELATRTGTPVAEVLDAARRAAPREV